MPPQHQNCQNDTTSTVSASVISPSSMTSELNSAVNNTMNQTGNYNNSLTWQKDRLFLEDLQDVLTLMRAQEASYERRRIRKLKEWQRKVMGTTDHRISNLPPFHDSWRPVMVSWMYHIADTFRLMPVVVATGVYILDTCALDLCNPSSRTYKQKELYPLMTMTALNMAVKCHETKMFPLDQLVQLLGAGGGAASGRCYTPEDVIAMESRLLVRCGWKLHCPTTHDYLLRFVTVLGEQHQGVVTSFAVRHLKQNLLWEHVLHQEKQEQALFSTCTMAYAAFLLAMEDAELPLEDKQAACLALLQVANLSAKTSRLGNAYNWLFEAMSLQKRLEEGNNNLGVQTAAIATESPIPSHPVAQRVEDEASTRTSDEMSCDTRQSQQEVSPPDAAIVKPETDDENDIADDQSTSLMSYGSSITSDHSVIFYSYSSDGDAVEVVATDNVLVEDESDDESMDRSANLTVLPTVEEEEEAPVSSLPIVTAGVCGVDDHDDNVNRSLVLSESLDEDGFEIALERKHADSRLTNVISPRDVTIGL